MYKNKDTGHIVGRSHHAHWATWIQKPSSRHEHMQAPEKCSVLIQHSRPDAPTQPETEENVKERKAIEKQEDFFFFECDKLTTYDRPDILHLMFEDVNRLGLRFAFPPSGSACL